IVNSKVVVKTTINRQDKVLVFQILSNDLSTTLKTLDSDFRFLDDTNRVTKVLDLTEVIGVRDSVNNGLLTERLLDLLRENLRRPSLTLKLIIAGGRSKSITRHILISF